MSAAEAETVEAEHVAADAGLEIRDAVGALCPFAITKISLPPPPVRMSLPPPPSMRLAALLPTIWFALPIAEALHVPISVRFSTSWSLGKTRRRCT